jgi:molecular chaperone DnaK
MDDPVLAIDFGTSVTSGMLVNGSDNRPVLIKQKLGREADHWPSAVLWDDEKLVVGRIAEQRELVSPWRFRRGFKRSLRDKTPLVLGDKHFSAVELVCNILAEMRDVATKQCGEEVARVVLTVPPSYLEFGDGRAELMVQAGRSAKFTEVELLAEPVAASMAKLAGGRQFAPGERILVYDFGGGTFDAALVEIGELGRGRRIPARSLDRCGGMDIDAAICEWFLQHGPTELARLLPGQARYGDDESALGALIELTARCEDLKEQLTNEPTKAVAAFGRTTLTLTRKQLEELAGPWVAMTVQCCRDLLKAEHVEPDELAGIMLVGGGSKMALVRAALVSWLGDEFEDRIYDASDQELAVVEGAAVFAAGAAGRVVEHPEDDAAERGVRWPIPGDMGKLLCWHVKPGQDYRRGEDLAQLRLPTGEIYRVRDDQDGVVVRRHAGIGQWVRGSDWLLTAGWPHRDWKAGPGYTDPSPFAGAAPGVQGGRLFAGTRSGVVEARVVRTGALCWRHDVRNEVTSAATVAGGCVYVGCRDGTVHVLDQRTGERAGDPLQAGGEAIRLAPTVGHGLVCVVSDDDYLRVFYQDGRPWQVFAPGRRIETAPVIADGIIYIGVSEGGLYALDAATGRPLAGEWPVPGAGDSAPLTAGRFIYARRAGGGPLMLDARSGRQILPRSQPAPPEPPASIKGRLREFKQSVVDRGKEPSSRFAVPWLLNDGVILTGTADGSLAVFSADTLDQVDTQPVSRWKSPLLGLALSDDTVYAASGDHHLYALAGGNLHMKWSYDIKAMIRGAPAIAGSMVLAIDADGLLHAVDSALHASGDGTPGD